MKLKYDDLTARQFDLGDQDCFSLGREFFWNNFRLKITNYARPQDWSSDSLDLIRMLHEREGFEMITDFKIKDLRPADVLCMAIGENNPNHFAIVVEDNQILHHLANRLSNVEILRDFWRNSICFVLRHPFIPDLRPKYPDVDIKELLNARYNLDTPTDADTGGDTGEVRSDPELG